MQNLYIFCWILTVLLITVFFFRSIYKVLQLETTKKGVIKRIAEGKYVTLKYILSDKNGELLDDKYKNEYFTYIHGDGQILAGLEKRLTGLPVGKIKKIVVPVSEAYGEINDDDIIEVDKKKVPDDAAKVGALLKEIGEGKKPGKIIKVKEDTLIIDYNHPLASKKLVFDVEVIDVEDVDNVKSDRPINVPPKEVPTIDSVKKPEDKNITISDNCIVNLEYILTDSYGNVIEEKIGENSIKYIHGKGEIKNGLEKRLTGLTAGTITSFEVPPEDGFGKIDPAAFQDINKDEIFTDSLTVGTILSGIGPDKKDAKIHEIKDNTVILDFNHPLAGQTLKYEVNILSVERDPSALEEEIESTTESPQTESLSENESSNEETNEDNLTKGEPPQDSDTNSDDLSDDKEQINLSTTEETKESDLQTTENRDELQNKNIETESLSFDVSDNLENSSITEQSTENNDTDNISTETTIEESNINEDLTEKKDTYSEATEKINEQTSTSKITNSDDSSDANETENILDSSDLDVFNVDSSEQNKNIDVDVDVDETIEKEDLDDEQTSTSEIKDSDDSSDANETENILDSSDLDVFNVDSSEQNKNIDDEELIGKEDIDGEQTSTSEITNNDDSSNINETEDILKLSDLDVFDVDSNELKNNIDQKELSDNNFEERDQTVTFADEGMTDDVFNETYSNTADNQSGLMQDENINADDLFFTKSENKTSDKQETKSTEELTEDISINDNEDNIDDLEKTKDEVKYNIKNDDIHQADKIEKDIPELVKDTISDELEDENVNVNNLKADIDSNTQFDEIDTDFKNKDSNSIEIPISENPDEESGLLKESQNRLLSEENTHDLKADIEINTDSEDEVPNNIETSVNKDLEEEIQNSSLPDENISDSETDIDSNTQLNDLTTTKEDDFNDKETIASDEEEQNEESDLLKENINYLEAEIDSKTPLNKIDSDLNYETSNDIEIPTSEELDEESVLLEESQNSAKLLNENASSLETDFENNTQLSDIDSYLNDNYQEKSDKVSDESVLINESPNSSHLDENVSDIFIDSNPQLDDIDNDLKDEIPINNYQESGDELKEDNALIKENVSELDADFESNKQTDDISTDLKDKDLNDQGNDEELKDENYLLKENQNIKSFDADFNSSTELDEIGIDTKDEASDELKEENVDVNNFEDDIGTNTQLNDISSDIEEVDFNEEDNKDEEDLFKENQDSILLDEEVNTLESGFEDNTKTDDTVIDELTEPVKDTSNITVNNSDHIEEVIDKNIDEKFFNDLEKQETEESKTTDFDTLGNENIDESFAKINDETKNEEPSNDENKKEQTEILNNNQNNLLGDSNKDLDDKDIFKESVRHFGEESQQQKYNMNVDESTKDGKTSSTISDTDIKTLDEQNYENKIVSDTILDFDKKNIRLEDNIQDDGIVNEKITDITTDVNNETLKVKEQENINIIESSSDTVIYDNIEKNEDKESELTADNVISIDKKIVKDEHNSTYVDFNNVTPKPIKSRRKQFGITKEKSDIINNINALQEKLKNIEKSKVNTKDADIYDNKNRVAPLKNNQTDSKKNIKEYKEKINLNSTQKNKSNINNVDELSKSKLLNINRRKVKVSETINDLKMKLNDLENK